jgi:hypothetical protein
MSLPRLTRRTSLAGLTRRKKTEKINKPWELPNSLKVSKTKRKKINNSGKLNNRKRKKRKQSKKRNKRNKRN